MAFRFLNNFKSNQNLRKNVHAIAWALNEYLITKVVENLEKQIGKIVPLFLRMHRGINPPKGQSRNENR